MESDNGNTTCWEGSESGYLLDIPRFTLRARDLLRLVCLRGGGQASQMPPALPEICQQIIDHPDTLLTLTSAFDCRGGPYQFPKDDSAYQRRLDLHLLQRLQLVPGDTRPARELFRRLKTAVPTLDGLCVFAHPTENWPSWPADAVAAYGRGLLLPLPDPQTADEAAAAKAASVAEIAAAGRLYLRPHHLMCTMCYYGSGADEVLQIDNLWEPILRMREDPEVEITLVEGDCLVCPPCTSYDPRSGACITVCGLKDRRKDLDALQQLDLLPGTTMKARDLYRLYMERLPSAESVCHYTEAGRTIPEWTPCSTAREGRYEKGLERLAEDFGNV
jgi:hypothetical protein